MNNRSALESERLIFDFILDSPKSTKITDFTKSIYETELLNAKQLRAAMLRTSNPTAEDIMVVCRKLLAFGFSQKGVAAWFGVTTGTLSRWVSGDNPPREFMRTPIFQELGRIVDYVVERLEAYGDRKSALRQQQRPRQLHLANSASAVAQR
jgi:DNA-binding transcriptional regulator YiaG